MSYCIRDYDKEKPNKYTNNIFILGMVLFSIISLIFSSLYLAESSHIKDAFNLSNCKINNELESWVYGNPYTNWIGLEEIDDVV